MFEKAEKFLNIYTLLIVNLAIIAIAELIGTGRYFYDTGFIHLIGIIFIGLAVYRIFTRYYFQDQFFKKFLKLSLTAFTILATTQIFEYLWIKFLPLKQGMAEAGVIGLYFVSLLFLIAGLKFILGTAQQKPDINLRLPAIIMLLTVVFSIVFMASGAPIFEKNIEVFIYVYLVLVAILGIFAINTSLKIKKVLPLFKKFVNYLIPGIIFIVIASLFEFFKLLEFSFINEIQIAYLAHFAIYFALSFMFLGFGKLLNLGGIYEDIKEEFEKGNL